MTNANVITLHATAVAIAGYGVIFTGKSGSGKSDLALRLIDRGAVLISDDSVILKHADDKISLCGPEKLAGKLEVRSLGVLDFEHVADVELKMEVQLDQQVDRFPMDRQQNIFLGEAISSIKLDADETSAPIKVEMALKKLLKEEQT